MYHGIRRWRFGERTVLKDRPLINGGTTLIITVWFLLFCYPPCEHTITWLTSTNQQCSCPTSNLSMPWSWNPWSQQLWVFLFKTRKLWVCCFGRLNKVEVMDTVVISTTVALTWFYRRNPRKPFMLGYVFVNLLLMICHVVGKRWKTDNEWRPLVWLLIHQDSE